MPHPSRRLPEAPADGDDIERSRLSNILRVITAANLIALVAYTLLAPLNPASQPLRLWIVLPLFGLTLLCGALVRRGALRLAGLLTVSGLTLALAGVAAFNGGIRAPAFPGLLLMVLLGGLLLGTRAALAVAVASIAVGLATSAAEAAGLLDRAASVHSDGALLVAYTIYLVLAALIIGLTVDSMRAALARASAELGERRAALAAMRSSEEKFARAFSSSPVAMAVVRLSDGVVLDVNAAFGALLGLSREEALGRDVAELGIWADEGARQRAARALAASGALRELEFTFRRRDGALGEALFSAELIEFDGERCALAAALDLTARKRAEAERLRLDAQLLQAQKLESLGLLAGGIAHDFNNLMAGVLGNASLLLLDSPADDPRRPQLVAIEQAGRRASDLCEQLLTYAGRGRSSVEPVDMAALVQEMAGIVRVSVGRLADLVLDLRPGLPAVAGDASQLRQVVLNLVTNAAEAIGSGGGGRITVRLYARAYGAADLAALDPLAGVPPGCYLALEVADTGCGMDAETMRQIFDPFFTTKSTGHGLGLSAAQGIMRRHGGLIGVRSAPGAGTTFTLLLPPTSAAPESPAPSAPAAPWQAPGAVLAVDDEEAVLALARRIFERYGVPVICARGGREALELYHARAGEVALVLLDLTMPDLDGPATLAGLREANPALPVLISSGYSSVDIGELLADARTGFIQKPYRAQELIAKIRELLG